MAPRGLSMEEKKTKMLEIFHETAEFYSLKELEKIAPKSKGIVMQSVKDVLDDLVGDSLVIMEKIGTGNYFWSFPSTAGALKHGALVKAQRELESVTARIDESTAGLAEAEKGREDTADRRKLLSTLQELQATSHSLQNELAAFGAADPVKYEKKSQAVKVCKDAALRWTDNNMTLMQYAVGVGAEQEQLYSMLEIDDEWQDLKI